MNTARFGAGREECPIAIIGMDCMFPGARNLTGFWRSIRRGEDGITETPPTHWSVGDYVDPDPKAPDKTYCGRGGFLEPVPFDPTEFGIPPTILEATDTSQLLSLVVAKSALEDAGYGEGRDFNREQVSVILGVTGMQELVLPLSARLGHPLWRRALREAGVAPDVAEEVVERIADGYVSWQENSFPGLLGNVVAGRIANRLNLRGTNCVVDAACASALGAVHLAVLELASGRCDMALTGGADTLNNIFMYMCFSKTTALSPTGDVRPFSDEADGTVLGEGIGILVLKRLTDAQRDGDRIYAVIRGIGTSSDGRSQSIYAPHSAGQAAALRDAYRLAGFGPDTVELIEAHGTGTKVGDVAEVEGLKTVFREARSDGTWCALGSVKSQIGHTKAAAGVAGMIKAALAIHHRSLPPTIKVDRPNPRLNIEESPFFISTVLRPWVSRDGSPRRAGVSSFGFGGSNFHAVLEEHQSTLAEVAWDGSVEIIALSGSSVEELAEQLDGWVASADGERFDQAALAFEAAASRRGFSTADEHRLVIVVEHGVDVRGRLQQGRDMLAASGGDAGPAKLPSVFYGRGRPDGKVAFLFPGQGSQYIGMGRELACMFPEMVDVLAEADAIEGAVTEEDGRRLSDAVNPRPAFSDDVRERQAVLLTRTEIAQPALGAVNLGLSQVLGRFGVKPDLAAGHSYGELVALCAAGRFDAETLHRLSRLRGRLMAEGGGDRGTMLAVQAPLEEITRLVEEQELDVVLANRNAPSQGILSGDREAIGRAAQACQGRGFVTRPLPVSGAFHSRLMEGAVGPFRQALEAVSFGPASIPVYANTTGQTYPADAAAARSLLGRQMIKPVDFVGVVEHLYEAGARTFIEVGPKAVLSGLVRSILGDRPHQAVASDASCGRGPGLADLARVLARLGALGHPVKLGRWERPAREPRKPKMVLPLVGANYRSSTAKVPSTAEPGSVNPVRVPGRHAPAPTAPPASSAPTAPPASSAPTAPPAGLTEPGSVNPVSVPGWHAPAPTTGTPAVVASGRADPERSPLLAEALRMVREGLQAMQTLQRQTAEAHQRFLEGQEQSYKAYMDLMAQQQRLLGQSIGFPAEAPAAPLPAAARRDEPVLDMPKVAAEEMAAAPAPTMPSMWEGKPARADNEGEARIERSPISARSEVAAASQTGTSRDAEMASVVLEVVSEKTGYPQEMLDLDMDIEADLGIDSIKRVEIVAAVEERVPQWQGVGPEHMGSIRTLREIVAFLDSSETRPAAATAAVRPGAAGAGAPAAGPGESSVGGGSQQTAESFAGTLLAVVAELTGYPVEMLDLEMDMEADLGIDSIKRVEILAAVEARVPDLPPVKPEYMGSLRTLRQIVEYCGAEAPQTADAPTAPTGEVGSCRSRGEALQDTTPRSAESVVESRIESAPEARCGATSRSGGAAAGVVGTVDSVGPSRRRVDVVERRILTAVELPAGQDGRVNVAAGHEVWVTDDGAGLARAIVDRLVSARLAARVVEPAAAVCEGGIGVGATPRRQDRLVTSRLCGPEAPGAGAAETCARVGGLIIVAPPIEQDGASWGAGSEALLKGAFALAKAAAADLQAAAARGGALLATVSRMDGSFGLRGGGFDPTQGGLAGLAKTAAIEWPAVRCHAIDVALTWQDAEAAAAAVVHELSTDGPVEVGLYRGVRRGLTAVKGEISAGGAPDLVAGEVVVISGGARGVTAECALALAKNCQPTLVLLGRSPQPAQEPGLLAGLEGEAEIKQAVLLHDFEAGAKVSPVELQSAVGRRLADREVRRNLERISSSGSRVVYRAVDVRDEAAVRAVVEDVCSTLGPVRGIVHAAGVLADRRIVDKTPEQFAAVFDTKVGGLRHLLGAVARDELRHVGLFSSFSARYGNAGQVDYAMANEVLNKVAHRLAAELPTCRVVSMNWGPWDGGMVTPSLRRAFLRRGVALIPIEAGARCFVDELGQPRDTHAVEVILGAGPTGRVETPKHQNAEGSESRKSKVESRKLEHPTAEMPRTRDVAESRRQDARTLGSGGRAEDVGGFLLAFERTLDVERYPFLLSHVLDGHPVLPVAVMMEWLGHAAVHGNPGLLLHGFDDLRVCKGVVLRDGPQTVRLVAAKARRSGSLYEVEVALRGGASDEAGIVHARATAVLAAGFPAAPAAPVSEVTDSLAEEAYERGVEGAYEEVLFHGRQFRGIEGVEGISERGMVARLRAAPTPREWMAEPLRSDWLADPLVLDASFQMGILWCFEEMGVVSLPTCLGRYRQYRRGFPPEGVTAALQVGKREPHGMSGDFSFLDRQGVVVARIVGYECTADASLLAAFRRGSVAGATS